jgi:hypothetical protein
MHYLIIAKLEHYEGGFFDSRVNKSKIIQTTALAN